MLVVLVFTLALTGLGLMSARLAMGGEALARNQLDHQIAHQAAEAALRDAERDLLQAKAGQPGLAPCQRSAQERPVLQHLSAFTPTCTGGQCRRDEATTRAVHYGNADAAALGEVWWHPSKGGRWNNIAAADKQGNCNGFTGGVPLGTYTGAPALGGVAFQPEYMIELVDRSDVAFRITARGFGLRANTEVVLQTYFRVPSI